MSDSSITPVVLTALSGSNALRTGALQYGLRGSPTSQLPLPLLYEDDDDERWILPEPLRPDVARVVVTVLGLWVHPGPNDCRPGRHKAGCWHRENAILTSDTALTRQTTGEDGGAQVAAVRKALLAAARLSTTLVVPGETGYTEYVCHLLSYRRDVQLGDTHARLLIRLDPFIHDAMMKGLYTGMPMNIVRKLGGSDFLLWEQALVHPRTAKLKQAGETDALTLGGPRSSIPFDRIGLGRTRPDKRQAVIDRGVLAGNEVQGEWLLGLDGGHLIVQRLTDRKGTVSQDGSTVSQDGLDRKSGHENHAQSRSAPNAVDRIRPDRDRIETGFRSTFDEDHPELLFLEEHFHQPLRPDTDKLVGRLMREKGLAAAGAVEVMRAGAEEGSDPIEALRSFRRLGKPVLPVQDGVIFPDEPAA